MNEEEKKAIKELIEIKELVEEDLKYDDYEVTATLDQIDLKSLVTVLNLIEKQQKELEKKDKIIDKMAEAIDFFDIDLLANFDNEIQIVKYFTNLVEKENK